MSTRRIITTLLLSPTAVLALGCGKAPPDTVPPDDMAAPIDEDEDGYADPDGDGDGYADPDPPPSDLDDYADPDPPPSDYADPDDE